jgi:hypothetical protein
MLLALPDTVLQHVVSFVCADEVVHGTVGANAYGKTRSVSWTKNIKFTCKTLRALIKKSDFMNRVVASEVARKQANAHVIFRELCSAIPTMPGFEGLIPVASHDDPDYLTVDERWALEFKNHTIVVVNAQHMLTAVPGISMVRLSYPAGETTRSYTGPLTQVVENWIHACRQAVTPCLENIQVAMTVLENVEDATETQLENVEDAYRSPWDLWTLDNSGYYW